MPRRQSGAFHACELCRRRKRRCDGDGASPCKACRDGDTECVYPTPTRVSKAYLRGEVIRLQMANSDNSALLDAISSPKTSPAQLSSILQRLCNGHSRADVTEMITRTPGSRAADGGGDSRGHSSDSIHTSASNSETLLSSVQDGHQESPLPGRPTTPPPAASSPTPSHLQANLVYYRLQLPQLLDFMLAQDCLSFCPIDKARLLRDLESDTGPYCSPALVDGLLALATVVAREKMAAIMAPRARSGDHVEQGHLGDAFARMTIAALHEGSGLPQQMADIQVIGILALYYLNCEKIKDGMGFAGDFFAAIADKWQADRAVLSLDDHQTLASTYCAAVSLNRLLFLVQDYHTSLDEVALRVGMDKARLHNSSRTDILISKVSLSVSIIDDAFLAQDPSLLPYNQKAIEAKIFEFTERLYKARFLCEKKFDEAIRAYHGALRWYESFFAYTSSPCYETPLILFAHAYYQFGVMCLLTPYVVEPAAITSDGTLPIEACRQAVSSIKQLIQHYSRLYNDEQLLNFMPFFKTAALAFLEICDGDDDDDDDDDDGGVVMVVMDS